jgi:hypothetical protein
MIDELNSEELRYGEEFLNNNSEKSPLDGLYWLALPKEILTKTQNLHLKNQGELKIAIEITKKSIKFELLIRSDCLNNTGGGNLNIKQLHFINKFYNNLYSFILKEGKL